MYNRSNRSLLKLQRMTTEKHRHGYTAETLISKESSQDTELVQTYARPWR